MNVCVLWLFIGTRMYACMDRMDAMWTCGPGNMRQQVARPMLNGFYAWGLYANVQVVIRIYWAFWPTAVWKLWKPSRASLSAITFLPHSTTSSGVISQDWASTGARVEMSDW